MEGTSSESRQDHPQSRLQTGERQGGETALAGPRSTDNLVVPAPERIFAPVANRPLGLYQDAAIDSQQLALIVDDEDDIRNLLTVVVQRMGYRALCAGDGRTALAQFTAYARQIVVVLLDLSMPVMTGGETLQALQAFDPTVRVLLMSGYAEVDLECPPECTTVKFLQKPFTIAQIQVAISNLVTVRPQAPRGD